MSSENGLVSAGAILVAIVALSCAIILVLLGITVYLCGHKGFGIRRACDRNRTRRSAGGHNQTAGSNNELTDSVIEPMKRATLTMKGLDSDRVNTTATNYSDPILIDPGSGTLLRCQFGTLAGANRANTVEYPDQKLLRVSSPRSYDTYTTCLPMGERVPVSGTYEAIPAGRFLFPISSGTFAGTNGTTVMVNNGEILHPKFAPGSFLSRIKTNPTRAPGLTSKPNPKRSTRKEFYDDRQFTQSLKVKRSDWLNACESPVSEGSGTMSNESKLGRLAQARTAKSWETLVAVPHTQKSEWSKFNKDNRKQNQKVPNVCESRTNDIVLDPKTSEFHSRVRWNRTSDPSNTAQDKNNEQRNVSTFLPGQSHTGHVTNRVQQGSNPFPTATTSCSFNPFVSSSNANQVEVYQDACGYSRLCKSTQLDQHSRNSHNLSSCAVQNADCTNQHQVSGLTSMELCSRKPTMSDNLIELLDSSHASSCSQSCDCAASSVDPNLALIQPQNTIPSYTEHSEFV